MIPGFLYFIPIFVLCATHNNSGSGASPLGSSFSKYNMTANHSLEGQPVTMASENRRQWRFQRSTNCGENEIYSTDQGKCFKKGSQPGPCGEEMQFNPSLEDPKRGRCDCKSSNERAYIYHSRFKRCYKIYTQGPCSSDSWIVLDQNKKPACEENPCLYNMFYEPLANKKKEFVAYNGECVELNQISDLCPAKGLKVTLTNFGSTPTCVPAESVRPLSLSSTQNDISCPEDYVRKLNECEKVVTFDFSLNE